VSKDPGLHLKNRTEDAKLRFLAIDAVSGRTINVPFAEESRRLRPPPFRDPL